MSNRLDDSCSYCGRRHHLPTLVPNPDRPGEVFCPAWAKSNRIMRLTLKERLAVARLLGSLNGGQA
ncbi:MAG TPA: hypothetical protein VIX86_04570 [Streptosporangiaceae bacterium]